MHSIHLKACVKLIGRWNSVKMHGVQDEIGHAGNLSFDLYAFCFELWPVSPLSINI